ncbi:MAG: glucose-6-phosphate isomerase [Candidatus Marinimicrobia bacterium]|nr:glucose-6-phosphate isomerase [Candidatus Neomarinimicrobiota bacterium]
MIQIVDKYIKERYKDNYQQVRDEARIALKTLIARNGKGNDFLGWLDLPDQTPAHLDHLKEVAEEIHRSGDLLVCIGIGGSYLGSKAFIHALYGENHRIKFIGHHLSPLELHDLLDELEEKDFYINVISKSGTTTEPGVTFRILREFAEKKYGDDANRRIIATTDAKKGALRELTRQKGYRSFIIPDDVGGRFSVLTPVGLLPILAAGADMDQIIRGSVSGFKFALTDNVDNPALNYVTSRNLCYRDGKAIEIMASMEPRLHYLSEWWKQLFGESEGKDGKGIFPASVDFTTDLHSMGQWIQDGVRNIFETFLIIDHYQKDVIIPADDANLDKLNYLAGKKLSEVNQKAYKGTKHAHEDGGVPTMVIHFDYLDEEHLAKLCVILEVSVAISGYMLGVNPFDQPGVETYKKNMFALLGKPGV